jgi:hypothetical protein
VENRLDALRAVAGVGACSVRGMERPGFSSDFWGLAPGVIVCALNPKP